MPNVQQLLGHSTITMTMRYAHVAPSALRESIDLLSPKGTLSVTFGQPAVNRQKETQNELIKKR